MLCLNDFFLQQRRSIDAVGLTPGLMHTSGRQSLYSLYIWQQIPKIKSLVQWIRFLKMLQLSSIGGPHCSPTTWLYLILNYVAQRTHRPWYHTPVPGPVPAWDWRSTTVRIIQSLLIPYRYQYDIWHQIPKIKSLVQWIRFLKMLQLSSIDGPHCTVMD